MPRGNPDNLRAAAHRKRTVATLRAEAALGELVARCQPVTFRGLAKAAGVSVDFLYRSSLRPRIEEFRAAAPIAAASAEQAPSSDSQVVHALAAQLRELKRRPRRDHRTAKRPRRRPRREPRAAPSGLSSVAR